MDGVVFIDLNKQVNDCLEKENGELKSRLSGDDVDLEASVKKLQV